MIRRGPAGRSLFQPEAIERIIVAVGTEHPIVELAGVTLKSPRGRTKRSTVSSRFALSDRLWKAAYRYALATTNKRARASPSDRRAYFRAVRDASEGLIEALSPRGRWPSWVDVDVGDLPYEDFDPRVAAAWIRDAARAGERMIAPQINRKPGNAGNPAMRELVLDLAWTWKDLFRAEPRLSRPSSGGAPTGAFLQFCEAALKEIARLEDFPRLAWSTESLAHLIRGAQTDMAKSAPKKT